MNHSFLQIRQHFSPSQPSVRNARADVSYREYIPTHALTPYVYCYWQLKTNQKLETAFFYRVVSDGCIDIFFELETERRPYVMGLATAYTEFPLAMEFNYIGIRFLPSIFPQLFNVPASDLTNKTALLDQIHAQTADFIKNQIKPDFEIKHIVNLFDQYLTSLILSHQFDDDSRFYDALHTILKSRGCHEIQALNTGISPRQLRRLFKHFIGDSPKTFSKIVRFQHVLKAKPSVQSLRRDKLFYDVGYFDQAHFIRDFKHLYGQTPRQALK